MSQIPGYSEWSDRKAAEGEAEGFIANLDARSMWLLHEDLLTVTEADFEEMLEELKDSCAELERMDR